MALSKEERYAKLKARRATPEAKEKQRIASKKYRSTPEYRECKKHYRSTQKAKDVRRNQLLLKNFGITLEEYTQRFNEQGGVCAICLKPELFVLRGVVLSLAVDHCHKTNRVRGLLCRNCNQGLGQFRDNIPNIQRAITYLQV